MKLKLCILGVVGLISWTSAALGQTNNPSTEPTATAVGTTTNADAAPPPAPANPDSKAATATVAAADTAAQAADAPAQPAATAADAAATDTNSPVVPGAVIPLIVMDDVPLTDAIKNLARQAALNYILDPKVAFGQPGPDGRPIPQPSVSIRWENVTAGQALNALLSTYSLQMVEDPKSKIARVTLKDPAAPEPLLTKVVQLKYASPTNIVSALQNTFTDKRSKVIPDVRTSQLVVLATEKELADVDALVEQLDTRTKQVLIEARLLETSENPKTTKGVDWTSTLQGQNVYFGNGSMSGQSTTTMPGTPTTTTTPGGRPITTAASSSVSTVLNSVIGGGGLGLDTARGFTPNTFFLNADGVHAVLSFLNTYADAKVLSTPRTVTLDNETARIQVTRASPIINITPGSVQTAGGSAITYTNLGVILNVTPRISANSYINLKVEPEVSRIFDTVTKLVSVGTGTGTYQADEYDIRKIETRVMIPSGNTLVMGGMMQDDVRSGNTKVPVLGDIPVLGYLFRSDTKSRQKSNLLVFVTPTIVRDEDFQPTATGFLKNRVPTQDTVDGDWSAWDSGKPKDWSNDSDTKGQYRRESPDAENRPGRRDELSANLGQPECPPLKPMKKTILTCAGRVAAHSGRGCLLLGIQAITALLLSALPAGAMPSVKTVTGGPTAGYIDGDTANVALFHSPMGMAMDTFGMSLYVADRDNNAVRELNLGANLTFTFAQAGLDHPVAVALDASGNVYVLNQGNGTLVEFDGFGNPLGTIASGLVNANGMVIDKLGNLYLTVQNNSVLEISPAGAQSIIATVTDPAAVLQGLTLEDSGYLAVCDSGRNGILLVNPSTGDLVNLTGFNGAGDRFGSAAFAKFNQPMGITAAGSGVLIVTDFGNNRVKVVSGNGTVTNLYGVDASFWMTGSGTYPGWADGTVCAGDVNYNAYGCVESRSPVGVLFASDGSVYTTEDYYHIIRNVTGASLPVHAPPPPGVPAPEIGWVAFTPPSATQPSVSVLQINQPFIFNNDVIIAIMGTSGTETHFTFGATPVGVDTIPNPDPTTGSTPPPYQDGLFPNQVPPSILPNVMPDVTIKAIGSAPGRQSSQVVSAEFQFKVANPSLIGTNAASFSVTNLTLNAEMWYTIDGSDPVQGPPSIGPLSAGSTVSLTITSNTLFSIRGFRSGYQPSDIVRVNFTTESFVPNSISFGFDSGEASSDFVASPGQLFYAPVTLNVLPTTVIDSLQFNLTITNGGPNPGPSVNPSSFRFQSMLTKPDPENPGYVIGIPPAMFLQMSVAPPAVPATGLYPVYYGTNPPLWFENMTFVDTGLNLMGVGWLERQGKTNLFDTLSQDLIQTSQAHDTSFNQKDGKVILGGLAFTVPATAAPGQTYEIQVGKPSATSDGVGMPGAAVYIATPTNGSLAGGPMNSIKVVTAGQRKYIAGDSAPFRWFNAGDFGDTNLDNSDVMQVFQSAVYGLNSPPPGSDFFDSMDSCGRFYTQSPNGYLLPAGLVTNPNALFNGNDSTINQIAFGDGVLDVCDVYVTFRRSLDPSLTLFRRFWTNGILAAEIVSPGVLQPPLVVASMTNPPSIAFATSDAIVGPGQTVQVPITVQTYGDYPLRVAMISLSVKPLDGAPALTTPVQFTPAAALGQPAITMAPGTSAYAATWLDTTVAGVKGTATLGTLTVTIPANAPASAAYAIHFDHASGSPNGLGSFPKRTATGLITLADRSSSTYGDGIPDSWRLRYFGTVNNLLSQATADADGDGASNWQEYVAGTDPTDAKSCLKVSTDQTAAQQSQDCVVHWPSVQGKQYVIERATDIFSGNWSPVSTNNGTGADLEFHDVNAGNVRFYRVRVAP